MSSYAKAYTEVLELLRHLPSKEYSKIPQEKIDFLKNNMDKDYKYEINSNIDLAEHYISKEANTILISIFRDYFASDSQKEILNNLLKQNQERIEKEKRKMYNPDNIFKNKTSYTKTQMVENTVAMLEYKESIFTKIKNWLKQIFSK